MIERGKAQDRERTHTRERSFVSYLSLLCELEVHWEQTAMLFTACLESQAHPDLISPAHIRQQVLRKYSTTLNKLNPTLNSLNH